MENQNKTQAEILSDGVYKWRNYTEIPTSTLMSFFGLRNMVDEKKLNIIFGIYIGLIKHQLISLKLLENCYLSNRLDELIKKKHQFNKTGYYEMFRKNKIVIGNTNPNGKKSLFPDEIKNDDYCPYCDHIGFITKHNFLNIDCNECFVFLCKHCADMDCVNGYYHKDCLEKIK